MPDQSIELSNILSRFMQSSVIFFTLSKNWNNGLKAAHIFESIQNLSRIQEKNHEGNTDRIKL